MNDQLGLVFASYIFHFSCESWITDDDVLITV